jgi:fumarylacetoacetate (FAA) hydrolase
MKLASLKNDSRDGCLTIVSQDLTVATDASHIAPSLRVALDNWSTVEAELYELDRKLNLGEVSSVFAFDPKQCEAPMPRTWQWLDGSCFLSHGDLMQKAFHLDPIEGADKIPLMYQGAGDYFSGPHDELAFHDESFGIDFEGEFAVIVDEVPMGTSAKDALAYVRLIMMLNDVSLRTFAPREMKTGFGFVQAKPTTSFAPIAVTPEELGDYWKDGRIHLPLNVAWNGEWFGNPHGGEMGFGFGDLIAHAALTRTLSAGTVIGSGTVSNYDRSVGSACISERRAIDMIEFGTVKTDFMKFGDSIRMETVMPDGGELFGVIDQKIVKAD